MVLNERHRWRAKYVCTTGAALLAGSSASAQMLLEVPMSGQPLSYLRDGATYGCGIRIIALSGGVEKPAYTRVVDVSANLYSDGRALVKLASQDVTTDASGRQFKKRVPVKVLNGWLRGENADATNAIDGSTRQGSNPEGSLLYASTFETAAAVFLAATKQRTVRISLKLDNKGTDRVYFGIPKLTAAEVEQMQQCVGELQAAANKR